MEKITLTRQELYDLVWKESLIALSKRFNIPYANFRKICIKMNVPIPPNGHWSKIQFGKPIDIIELPQDYHSENEIELYLSTDDISNQEGLTFHKKSDVELIKEDKTLPLIVPIKLTNPDKLVEEAHKRLTEYKYNRYNDHGMVRSEDGALKIRVARENIGRAFRFMDTLIKLLRARGHNIVVDYNRASAVIDGEKFDISLMEKCKKVTPDREGDSAIYEHTGVLYFTIEGYYGRHWMDGNVPIEEKLADILAKLEALAKREKEENQYYAEQRRIQEEQERIIREQQ